MSEEIKIAIKLMAMVGGIIGVAAVLICAAKVNGEDCQCDRCRAKGDDETRA